MWYDIAYCISFMGFWRWIGLTFIQKSKCRRIHSKSSTTSKDRAKQGYVEDFDEVKNAAPLLPAPGNKKWCKDCSASASKSQVSMVFVTNFIQFFILWKLIPKLALNTSGYFFSQNSQLLSHSLTLALHAGSAWCSLPWDSWIRPH